MFLLPAQLLDKFRQNWTEFKSLRLGYDKRKNRVYKKFGLIFAHLATFSPCNWILEHFIFWSMLHTVYNIKAWLSCGCLACGPDVCAGTGPSLNLLYGYICMLHSAPDILMMVIVSRVQAWLVNYRRLCKVPCPVIVECPNMSVLFYSHTV